MMTSENNTNSQAYSTNTTDRSLSENMLYNLLFAGKITLTEYLRQLKGGDQKAQSN